MLFCSRKAWGMPERRLEAWLLKQVLMLEEGKEHRANKMLCQNITLFCLSLKRKNNEETMYSLDSPTHCRCRSCHHCYIECASHDGSRGIHDKPSDADLDWAYYTVFFLA
jgi:hypothetical protein